jgi:hypothetical protein
MKKTWILIIIALMLAAGCGKNADNATLAEIERIKTGDFSGIVEADQRETAAYVTSVSDGMVWVEHDINGDGLNELIYQLVDSGYKDMKPIAAVFAFQNQETRLVISDTIDGSEFYFLSENGNIIYHYSYYSYFNEDIYYYCAFDSECAPERVYGLHVLNIFDMSSMPGKWAEEHPDTPTQGVYYTKHAARDDGWRQEKMEKRQFEKAFEEMTGSSVNDMKWGGALWPGL